MSPRPRLEDQHPDLESAIKEKAWQQIAEKGAASLSLRGIARALNITAPAIYNYFPNRDALVTALIVDAFQSFGDAQIDAVAALPEDDHARRLRNLGLAYRQWAVDHPQRYQLIFGTPIPGYDAPVEITGPVAARGLTALVEVLDAAHRADQLNPTYEAAMSPEVESMLRAWECSRAPGIDLDILFTALVIWGRVHGLVSLEIGNQLPPAITDAGAIYRRDVDILVSQLIGE